jgi:hypothetical protein
MGCFFSNMWMTRIFSRICKHMLRFEISFRQHFLMEHTVIIFLETVITTSLCCIAKKQTSFKIVT